MARNFLKPFATSVATLLLTAQAHASIPEAPVEKPQVTINAGDLSAPFDLVIDRAEGTQQMATHVSHSSHVSHASHSSHVSSSY